MVGQAKMYQTKSVLWDPIPRLTDKALSITCFREAQHVNTM